MRSRRKMETVRIRKANATIEKEKVVCFAQDRDVSTRMLAILSVSKTKSYVSSAVKYCTEIKNSFREDPSTIAYAITYRKDIRRIINETLIWSKTNQGTSFWSNVYNMAENIE